MSKVMDDILWCCHILKSDYWKMSMKDLRDIGENLRSFEAECCLRIILVMLHFLNLSYI